MLFGLPVNGKRISFTENVFYEFRDQRIEQVWSVIDKATIESQLSPFRTVFANPGRPKPEIAE
jgi:predicted ester cyclase